jgi:hypothetical protein
MLRDQRSGSDRRLFEKANQRLKRYRRRREGEKARRRWGELFKRVGNRSIKEGVQHCLAGPAASLTDEDPFST